MNILNILYFSPKFGGGIVKHLIALGVAVKSSGHNLILGFTKKCEWQEELQAYARVIIIPEIENPLRSGFPSILREICKFHSIDIIHFHFLFALPFSLTFSTKRWNVPIIYHRHNPPVSLNKFLTSPKSLSGLLRRLFSSLVARFTDSRVIYRHISISKEITELLLRNKWTSKEKIIFLPNGVSGTLTKKNILPTETTSVPIIGTVANFRPQKDYETLLNAFKILIESGKQYKFWLVGDGPNKPHIEKLAKEMEIDRYIRFIGTLANPSEMYHMFSIFVLSTHYEGHPLVILEAMSFGLPIVASRISSIAEIIKDGVNGLLVNPKDPHDMAEAIQKLLTDQLMYVQLSEAALKTFKAQLSVNEWAEKVLSVYESVVPGRSQ